MHATVIAGEGMRSERLRFGFPFISFPFLVDRLVAAVSAAEVRLSMGEAKAPPYGQDGIRCAGCRPHARAARDLSRSLAG